MLEKLSSTIKSIGDVVDLVANHGIWKILQSILIILVIVMFLNPAGTVEKISGVIQQINKEKREYRLQNDPIIRGVLHEAVWNLNATRASVLEFHNGKSNPSGLGFYFADMNYEIVRNNDCYVSQQYQNVNLSLINLPDYLYDNGYWYGTVEDLRELDPKLASMIATNGTNWIAFLLLEGSDDLGILELSFAEAPADLKAVGREIRKVGSTISGCLDFTNRNKKKK